MERLVNEIAADLIDAAKAQGRALKTPKPWQQVIPYARPYLEAMLTMRSIEDNYIFERGESIVRYCLANLQQLKGEQARMLKDELKNLLPENRKAA
jgi:hypothetical protein